MFLPHRRGWERTKRQNKHSSANSRASRVCSFQTSTLKIIREQRAARRKIVERDAAASTFHFGEHPRVAADALCLNASLTRYEPLSRGDRVINKTANETLDSRPFFLLATLPRARLANAGECEERDTTVSRGYAYDDTYVHTHARRTRAFLLPLCVLPLCHRVN